MKVNWRRINDTLYPRPKGSDLDTLPLGVYRLSTDAAGNQQLDYLEESFSLPSKMYDINSAFLDRVSKAWFHTDTNLGVLLSGLKGTGKSVMAKQLANNSKLPTIIVDRESGDCVQFITKNIDQDVCLFFDEFEKNLDIKSEAEKKLSTILSMLDGTGCKNGRLFSIFTVNRSYGMDYLLNRPGRIRYHLEYDSLPESVFELIIDDRLKLPELKDDLMEICRKVNDLSIDTVTKLVDEVNLFRLPASQLVGDMNVEFKQFGYDLTIVQLAEDNTPTVYITHKTNQRCSSPKGMRMEDCVYINDAYIGDVIGYIDDNNIIIRCETYKAQQHGVEIDPSILKKKKAGQEVYVNLLIKFKLSTKNLYSGLSRYIDL